MYLFGRKPEPVRQQDLADTLIKALYRGFLRRVPEDSDLLHWREQLRDLDNLGAVIESFLNSQEFRARHPTFSNPYEHDGSPRQHVESEVDENLLNAIWSHIESTWSKLGSDDPYYSVLTNPRYRRTAKPDAGVLEEFYNSGRGDVERLEKWSARNGLLLNRNSVVAEYGCGVGRVTQWLAHRFSSVLAIDISRNHLDLAAARAKAEGLHNVRFMKIGNRRDLAVLQGVDLFYSVIVLQHNPPPIILTILESAFRGLNPGGVAFFQVPTYGPHGYAFKASDYVEKLGTGEMEMHVLDQKTILRLAHSHGMTPCEVSQDFCTGGMGVSTTFFMQKG
jgi:SAM-dependent methyltransferase